MKKATIQFTAFGVLLLCFIWSCKPKPTSNELAQQRIKDSIIQARIDDSTKWAEAKKVQEEGWRKMRLTDSLHYIAKPLITSKVARELEPVIKKWLNFHEITISNFKQVSQDSIIMLPIYRTAKPFI